MKIYLYKKENEEEVYYKIDANEEEYTLNFRRIKDLSKIILDKKSAGEDLNIDVSVEDSSLDIYKTTLDNVFKSIRDDEELFNLYTETTTDDEVENDVAEMSVNDSLEEVTLDVEN